MDENGMRFDEESVEELTRALYQVSTLLITKKSGRACKESKADFQDKCRQ